MTRAIVLAAGTSDTWDSYLGCRKQAIPIYDVPLIHRTVRQLADRGVNDIGVVCWPHDEPLFVKKPAKWICPQHVNRNWVHEQEQSRIFWNTLGKTILLYGDTYYTDELIDMMVADPADDWHVYARMEGSENTGKPHGEMWGWTFMPQHHHDLDAAREVAIAYTQHGLWWRCLGWELYRVANKFLPWDHQTEDTHFVEWDDATEDFDTAEDWLEWAKRNSDRH